MGTTLWDFIFNSVMWNSSAFLVQLDAKTKEKSPEKYGSMPIGTWITQGNITEQALIKFFMDDCGPEGCNAHKDKLAEVKETVIQFTSQRKKASVIVKTDTGYRVYCKGAPDVLMPECNWIVLGEG